MRIRVVVGGIMCRDFHSLGRGEGEAARAVASREEEVSFSDNREDAHNEVWCNDLCCS